MNVTRWHRSPTDSSRRAVGHVKDLWFWLRRLNRVAQLSIAAIVVVTGATVVALVNLEPARLDIAASDVDTYNLLTNVASELTVDFESAVTRLPSDMVTNLVTSQEEGVTGVVALMAPSGTCLGFTVDVPLRLDDGTLARPSVGEVSEQPASMCDR